MIKQNQTSCYDPHSLPPLVPYRSKLAPKRTSRDRKCSSKGVGRRGIVLKHRNCSQKGPLPCRPMPLLVRLWRDGVSEKVNSRRPESDCKAMFKRLRYWTTLSGSPLEGETRRDFKRDPILGGTTCLKLLVSCGLVCFMRASSCQGSSYFATWFATFDK